MLQFAFCIKLVKLLSTLVVKKSFLGPPASPRSAISVRSSNPCSACWVPPARTPWDSVHHGRRRGPADSTTIRLSAMSREQGTQIMRYVGAPNLFIQAPFMIEVRWPHRWGAAFAIGTRSRVCTRRPGWMAPAFMDELIDMWRGGQLSDADPSCRVVLAIIASAFSLAGTRRRESCPAFVVPVAAWSAQVLALAFASFIATIRRCSRARDDDRELRTPP